jgi:threonine/homoserine/homoserine lactone efflux protein
VATPGPEVAAILARALGRGVAGAPAFIGGFVAGDLLSFTLAALGLAVLAQRAQALFVGVRFAGALYLLYLAWRLRRAPPGALDAALAPPRESALQLFLGGLALTLGKPNAMKQQGGCHPDVTDCISSGARGISVSQLTAPRSRALPDCFEQRLVIS